MRVFLKSFPIVLMCLTTIVTSAQEDKVWPMAEYMPSLQGCENKKDRNERRTCSNDKVTEHLVTYLKYPAEAKKAGEEGSAVISFVVLTDGSVTDFAIDEDPGFGMGASALKAVKKLNKLWLPGENKGETVNVRMRIPVRFVLPESKEKTAPPAPVKDVYTNVDDMPAFQGCEDKAASESRQCTFQKIMEYTNENLKYPEEAKAAKIEGTVRIKFVINEEGTLTSPMIIDGIGGGCDEEALRVLNSMPTWKAGIQDGKPVKVEMELPFRFQMRGEKE